MLCQLFPSFMSSYTDAGMFFVSARVDKQSINALHSLRGRPYIFRLSLTKEVLEGLRCLFDTVISTNLLYNEEMSVHNIIMDGGEAKYSSQPP